MAVIHGAGVIEKAQDYFGQLSIGLSILRTGRWFGSLLAVASSSKPDLPIYLACGPAWRYSPCSANMIRKNHPGYEGKNPGPYL